MRTEIESKAGRETITFGDGVKIILSPRRGQNSKPAFKKGNESNFLPELFDELEMKLFEIQLIVMQNILSLELHALIGLIFAMLWFLS